MSETFTEDQLKVIVEAASKAAHAAITERNKSFEKKFDNFLENFKAPQVKEEAPEVKETKEEKNNFFSATKSRLDSVEAENKALRDRIKYDNEKSFDRALTEGLTSRGIPAEQVRAVTALIKADGLAKLDEKTGNMFFKGEHDNEMVPLEEGIDAWVKGSGSVYVSSNRPNPATPGNRDMRRLPTDKKLDLNSPEGDEFLYNGIKNLFG